MYTSSYRTRPKLEFPDSIGHLVRGSNYMSKFAELSPEHEIAPTLLAWSFRITEDIERRIQMEYETELSEVKNNGK